MDVSAVIKQNFAYRMLFTQRYLLILSNVHCYLPYTFYSETIDFSLISAVAGISLLHVRLSYVIKGLTCLLTYLI